MKKTLAALMIAAITLAVSVAPAEAKRVGGGSSFGKQSQNVSRSAPAAPSQAAKPAPAAPAAAPNAAPVPPKPASPWKGILGGALLGLGLGALFSHLGMGAGMASAISSILMIALLAMAAMFIYRMFKRRNEPQAAAAAASPYAFAPTPQQPVQPVWEQPAALAGSQPAAGAAHAAGTANEATWTIPAGFDVPGFLRHAKTYYIRLQAAWDKGDLDDLREFTSTEMFAELRMQLTERGAASNVTDVQTLEAELLGVEDIGTHYMASVRFVGTIREDGGPTEGFAEVWNLTKPVNGNGGWVLAGIQQLN